MTKNDSNNIGVNNPMGLLQLGMAWIRHSLCPGDVKREVEPVDTKVRI